MYRFMTLSLMCAALSVGSGCTSVLKRGFKEAQGASTKPYEVPGTLAGDLSSFKGVNVSAPQTKLGGLVSAKFRQALPAALRKHLVEEEEAPLKGGTPIVNMEPEIMWYYDATGVSELAGSNSYANVLYTFSENGNPLGQVLLVTKNASSREGDEDLAESNAKELAAWLKDQAEKKAKAAG